MSENRARITRSMKRSRGKPYEPFDVNSEIIQAAQDGYTPSNGQGGTGANEEEPSLYFEAGTGNTRTVCITADPILQVKYIADEYHVDVEVAARVYDLLAVCQGRAVRIGDIAGEDLSHLVDIATQQIESTEGLLQRIGGSNIQPFSFLSEDEQREYSEKIGDPFFPTEREFERDIQENSMWAHAISVMERTQ